MRMTCRFNHSCLARGVSRAIVALMIVTGALPAGVAPRILRASDVTPPAPPPPRPAIVGFADTHLHQLSNLGFGGVEVWGSPMDPSGNPALFGTSESDPLRAAARRRALPNSDYLYLSNAAAMDYLSVADVPVVTVPTSQQCDTAPCWPQCPPGTGVQGNACWRIEIHGANGGADIINSFGGGASSHGTLGYPDMNGWPSFDVLTTQAAYWEWLKRAHDHGMQLMVMLAVNNSVLCHLGVHRASYGCGDDNSVDRQIQGAKDLEAYIDGVEGGPGMGFYRIVYSAAEARQAIADHKLAVVLGTEVDAAWGCTVDSPTCTEEAVEQHVQDYFNQGIRVVYPVHLADNAFGGSALYNSIFELNSFLQNGKFFDIVTTCDPQLEFRSSVRQAISDAKTAVEAAVVAFAIVGPAALLVLVPVLATALATAPGVGLFLPIVAAGLPLFAPFIAVGVALATAALVAFIAFAPGAVGNAPEPNCNNRGLTPVGATLVARLMDHQMIVDIDHSDGPTFDAILAIAEGRRYPGIVSGHTALVGTGLTEAEATPILQSMGREFDASETPRHEASKTDAMVARILNLGGVVSIGLNPGGRGKIRDFDPSDNVPFNCGSSSQAWAQTYLYATKHLGLTAINFGSDMNGFGGLPAPRYGAKACGGEPPAPGYSPTTGKLVYDASLTDYRGAPLEQYTFGLRTWDFNVDGFAHVGLYPDFIADLGKAGLTHDDLAPLFNGAEAYVRMWEKVDDHQPPTARCGTVGEDWHAGDVTVPCLAFDIGWDLANPADASFSLATNVPDGTETGDAATGTHPAICDKANQCTGTIPSITGINVDKKDPLVTVTVPAAGTPAYVLNQVIAASYGCTDGGSGVATCAGPIVSGASLDTSVGSHPFTVTGADNVGHSVSVARPYNVGFGVCLLYDPTKAHKAGSTVPIKLSLCDAAQHTVSQASVVVTATALTQVSTNASGVVEDAGAANPDDRFRYDASLRGYIFNLKTTGLRTGTYALSFTATGDPTTHTVQFQIR